MNTWSINAWNFEAGVSLHYYWPSVSPSLIKAPIPSIEGAVPMKWSFLFAKISASVEFDGSGAVQLGHDVGFLIPHVTIPPDNWWLIKIILLSKCKVMFARSTVFVNTHPAGSWFPLLLPLLNCGEPLNIPGSHLVDAAFRNTIKFTLTLGDYIRGRIYTMLDIGLSYLLGKAFDRFGGKFLSDKLGGVLGSFLGQNLSRIGIQVGGNTLGGILGTVISTILKTSTKKFTGKGISALIDGTSDSKNLGDLIYAIGVDGSPPEPRNPGQGILGRIPRFGTRGWESL